jgi:RND family efflux transporter MFP subunit
VREGEPVRKGEPLARLAGEELEAAAAEADAHVAERTAELDWARHELERQQRLRATGGVTQQILDRAHHESVTARARLEQAEAVARRARVQLGRSRLVAPRDGTLITRMVDTGEHVTPGTPLIVLADLTSLRIEAEVDEFDAGRVGPGSGAKITAEGHPGKVWEGHVTEVPRAVGARRLRPQDPGRPVDTRVVLVKIACPELELLKLGQRVDVTLEAPQAD